MRFFAEPPPDAPPPPDLPFWRRPLGPLGIAASILVVLSQVYVIGLLTLGPFESHKPDWILLLGPLALVGIGLIVGVLIEERRSKKETNRE